MEMMIGRYQIIKELGRGGMAVVYRALDPNIGREVALKLMSREFLADPEFHNRFVREARAIGALQSSAIVPLHDFGEDKGQPFLVMRLMTGGSLVERLHQGAMSVEEVSQFLTRIAEALDEAHAKGIIHRDLKPGNILLDHKGDAYLADFGIVKLLESNSMTSRGAIGTPAYMSPEHFEGEVSARSDIYALGVITFQLLTGKLPFQARTPSEWLKSHLMDTPLSLRQVNSQLPLALQPILERALAKNPEHRFQSAGEMARAMSAVVNQHSTGQLVSQPASQRFEDKPTVLGDSRPASQPTNRTVNQRSASQPISQPVTKPPQTMLWGWLAGAAILGLMGCGLILALWLWLNNGGVAVAVLPTVTPKADATETAIITSKPVETWTATPISPTDTPILSTATIAIPTATPILPTATPMPAIDTPILTELPASDPILTEPLNNISINQGDSLVLRWTGRELNPTQQEQFMVFLRNPRGENIALPDQGVTQVSEYPLPAAGLPPGQYSWLVVVQKQNEAGSFEDMNRSAIGLFKILSATAAVQPQPKVEATPTPAPVVAKRAAVYLESPTIDQAFTNRDADIQFQWSESSPTLAADEYYVLIINHKAGEDRTWLKTNRYSIDEKRWLIDNGPDLYWQVVVAQKRTEDVNEDPRGAERADYSEQRKFIWALPGPSDPNKQPDDPPPGGRID